MAKEKIEVKKIEKEFVIPLREKCRPVPRYKKTPKAIKTIKEFLVRHMKIHDRDLNKIKLDRSLNESIWARGIKNPPHKIKVKVIQDEDVVRVELIEMSKKLSAKKSREEKRETKAEAGKKEVVKKEEKPAPLGVPAKSELGGKDKNKDGVKDKKEESEKKEAVKEAGKEQGKAMAKTMKHESKISKEPKHRVRQAMEK